MSGTRSGLSVVKPVRDEPEAPWRPLQTTLFPTAFRTLCLVYMPKISEQEFKEAVSTVRPGQIFDLRIVPSFLMGRFTRRAAFELFDEMGSDYYDVPGLVGVSSRTEARLHGKAVLETIATAVNAVRDDRAIMLLVDDTEGLRSAASSVSEILPVSNPGWTIQVMPRSEPLSASITSPSAPSHAPR